MKQHTGRWEWSSSLLFPQRAILRSLCSVVRRQSSTSRSCCLDLKKKGQEMDAKTLKTVEERLTIEYENLTQLIRRGRLNADEIRIENTEDEGDLATISHARELFYNLQEGDVARLRSIEEARKSLARGEYGKCVRCAEDINEKRLEVVPWARMCLVCQGETEMEASMVLSGSGGDEPEF